MTVLLIDSHKVSQSTIAQALDGHSVDIAHDAEQAIHAASDRRPDVVILEMSLGGHSGMEFLYEFRTYEDRSTIPVIVYSSLRLGDDVLSSRAWQQLNVYAYLYKPEATLTQLKSAVEKAVVAP